MSRVTAEGANELGRNDLPDTFGVDDWNHFELALVGQKLFMILNKSEMIFTAFNLKEADGLFGTIGFGSNGMIAEFADIEMDCVTKGAFDKFLDQLTKGDEVTEEDMDSSTETTSEDGNGASSEPVVSFDSCISLNSTTARDKWIADNISDVKQVIFCNACCDTLAMPLQNEQCKTECESAMSITS